MARKIKLPDGAEGETDSSEELPVETPIATEPEPDAPPILELEPEPTAIPIVNLDDEIAKESVPVEQQQNGVNFWFGHVGMIKFPDKSEYHVRANRAYITDPLLIAKLLEAAKIPNAKIFPQ